MRKDLLTQAKGMVWHPWPDLWALQCVVLKGGPYCEGVEHYI